MAQNLSHPYRFDGRGRTREADDPSWIRGLVEQVLFTSPGERVMRPTFGSGVAQLVFQPNSLELAATTQALVQGALQQWLGTLLVVEKVEVEAVDAALVLRVSYVLRSTGEHRVETFTQGDPA